MVGKAKRKETLEIADFLSGGYKDSFIPAES